MQDRLVPSVPARGKPNETRYAWAAVALIFAISSVAAAYPAYRPAALPADTVLKVRLDDTIGSDRSRPGDRFTATVEDPDLPTGTLVRGVMVRVTPADHSKPGRLTVAFQTLEMPSGRQMPIQGTATGLDSMSVRTTRSGRLVAKSHHGGSTGKDTAIGAAGGLGIGSLLEKNVVGGLPGAGAGYLIGHHQDKKATQRDVVVKQGTELGIRLDQPVVPARA
jgi:hypothetical protein